MAVSLFKQYATDSKKEVVGILVTIGSVNDDGSIPKFRLSRMGRTNKRYMKAVEAATKPHLHAIRHNMLDPEVDERITLNLFCETILIDWENVIVPEVFDVETPIPYSKENAVKLMQALPELYNTLREQANIAANFRAEELELSAKN